MSFVYLAALGVALFAVAPFVAHLLQRRKADERAFPPARLVPPSQPISRRRRRVDDRALYAVRTAAVIALALLGATPFMRCSSLALGRQSGASIALAIVLDDSLSMLAQGQGGGKTRWERAQKAAQDLVSDAREGDAVAIVLAGAPPRIALASTTDLGALRGVVESLTPSHRATDLEGALELAARWCMGFLKSITASSCSAIWPTANPTLPRSVNRATSRFGRRSPIDRRRRKLRCFTSRSATWPRRDPGRLLAPGERQGALGRGGLWREGRRSSASPR